MNAPTLFDSMDSASSTQKMVDPYSLPRARRTDPATSHRAAAKVWSGWPELIIECLAVWGPASDDRICIRLNVDVRRWPTIKSARSRVTRAKNPAHRFIVATDDKENGQTIWRHKDYRAPAESVEIRNGAL